MSRQKSRCRAKNAFILKAEFGLDAALLSSTTAVRDASSRDKQQQRGEGDQISARRPSGAAGGGKWRFVQAPPTSTFNFVQKKTKTTQSSRGGVAESRAACMICEHFRVSGDQCGVGGLHGDLEGALCRKSGIGLVVCDTVELNTVMVQR